jgi:glutamine phosphoribosylpyrophosphate amidotransferase
MCEIVAVAWPEPRSARFVLERAAAVERLGIDGFGWGMSWLDGDGAVKGYRTIDSLAADDEGRAAMADIESTRFLVHLRRPTLLSTVQIADTQPFVAENGAFAFAHNGRFLDHEVLRPRYAAVLSGRADSEVGFRVFEERLAELDPPAAMASAVNDLGGHGNVVYLGADGEIVARSSHPLNPFWKFRVDGGVVASTACHSEDDTLFRLVFSDARDPLPIGPAPERVADRE